MEKELDLETLLNETLEEFDDQELQDQEFLNKFSQNVKIQESQNIKKAVDSIHQKPLEESDNVDDLLENLNSLLDNGELDSMLTNVMDQIVSKDLLYDPLKDLSSKYPEYLKTAKDTLSKEEYSRFEKQEIIINQILHLYDTQDDSTKVLKLMQEVRNKMLKVDARNWKSSF